MVCTALLAALVISQTVTPVKIINPENQSQGLGSANPLKVSCVSGCSSGSSGGSDGGYTIVIQGPGADGGIDWGVTVTGTVGISNTVTVTGPLTDTQLRASAVPVAASLSTRSDTFTVAANGTTVTATTTPFKSYSVQVKGTGAAATNWDVRLEGSLNNSTFTSILTHTDATGDGVVLYSGSSVAPSLYFRARLASITLGSASNVVVTILGVQ